MSLIYGKNPVVEAINSGKTINKIYVAKGSKDIYDVIKLAKDNRIVVVESDKKKLDKIFFGLALHPTKGYATMYHILRTDDRLSWTDGRERRNP